MSILFRQITRFKIANFFKIRIDTAANRRQIIEESKYLGGDLEHTHLVKGLDYALLQKVKAEAERGGGESSGKKGGGDGDDDEGGDEEKDEDGGGGKESSGDETDEENEADKAGSEPDDGRIRMSLKPKLLTKSTTAAFAAALNKSLAEPNAFVFKKLVDFQ